MSCVGVTPGDATTEGSGEVEGPLRTVGAEETPRRRPLAFPKLDFPTETFYLKVGNVFILHPVVLNPESTTCSLRSS